MFVANDALTASPAVLKVLDGVVDLHCHSGPSPFPRRLNHVDASWDGARINMRAILVKSHHHNTVMDLLAMESQLAESPTPVYGGVALNTEEGGINPSAVALSLGMGGRAVWAPTVSSAQHLKAHNHDDGFPAAALDLLEHEVSIFDGTGAVSADTVKVTQQVAEAGALLASGHLDGPSMLALFQTARDNGVTRMMLQHPDFIVQDTDEEIQAAIDLGAFVEHEIAMYHPQVEAPRWPIERLIGYIEKFGPEHTVINSDLGQKANPLPVDGYILIVGQLLDHGVPEKDIRTMICHNTAYLLGLEEKP
ncbi:DUF6282 family protein [Lacisediminihabitans profunda]|uniref:Amidohydrolase family protein n=1 Tax=Lacisediminihabitans profunda TaxID=2594790 RepID=A0A5C8UR08_9MICO|nr:DUF6282 family protein [Lacisediminihabitans profunda]TXN29980.1 hypothetical protein FVP33_12690 [Lacisediminihabitans profunda]